MLIIGHFETIFREHRINFDCNEETKKNHRLCCFHATKAALLAAGEHRIES